MGTIILGIIILAVGMLMTIYSEAAFQNFGRVAFAEKYLGTGESRLFYQLLGILLAVIGTSMIFNLHGKVIMAVLGPLFSGLKQ